MNKDELLEALNSFTKNNYNTILIDGPWGSGKTYLLNEFINSKENSHISFYYVSLYGLKSIDEINTVLYTEVHKDVKDIQGIVPMVINPFSSEFSASGRLRYILKMDSAKYNKIIIFDDLERYACSDYDSFLSYLNNLVGSGCKIIVVSNLEDFGSPERYLFDRYKEKIFDRIYLTELFDHDLLAKKFGKYQKYVDETILTIIKNNYRLADKTVGFLNEIEKHGIKIHEKFRKGLFFYVTMFISSYYESNRTYLNKVCLRLEPKQEEIIKKHLENNFDFEEVSLICIENLNLKINKPGFTDEFYLFLGLYKAYMFCKYDELDEYLTRNLQK